ncbi:hypothetical protein QJ48_24850 [Paenibacillus sp. A3]|uniref:hypothetical protein n=1 Tax=Paenibacillus sp. A3 TaxID=1337054 RepID=UPI0006D58B0A|nr:hypothetical protein [Paenibacillus sp. A3]KPV56967.1 hypothetical protein QJ48_24850 [Paenibacillus sp. A3]
MKKVFLFALSGITLLFISSIYFYVFNPKWIDQKINWSEKETKHGIELRYDYFDGEKKIPIQARKGDEIKVNYNYGGKGGIEVALRGPKGKYVEWQSKGTVLSVKAETDGEYHFVIKGNKMENGYIKVDWIVE